MKYTSEDVIQELCLFNGIKLIDSDKDKSFIEQSGMGEDYFKNCSCIYGKDEIVLGLYEDKELKLASFFHEFGHSKLQYSFFDTKYSIEKKAWKLGFSIAKHYGIYFGKNTMKWSNKQANTYFMWEWREMSGAPLKKVKYLLIDCAYRCFYSIKS